MKYFSLFIILFIDAAVVFCLFWQSFNGFRKGFVEEFGRFIGLFFSVVFAMQYYTKIAELLFRLMEVDLRILLATSFAMIFIVSFCILRIFIKMIDLFMVTKSKKWINKFFGSFFGLLKGTIVLVLFFGMIDVLPEKTWFNVILKESYFSKAIKDVRHQISYVLDWSDPILEGERFMRELLSREQESTQ